MKFLPALVLMTLGIFGLGGCAVSGSSSVASSGRSGCNNIDMASADIRNDPSYGLPPVPKN